MSAMREYDQMRQALHLIVAMAGEAGPRPSGALDKITALARSTLQKLNLKPEGARLIAAAPDLLEACRQALTHIEVDETTHGRPFSAGNVLRAAIAKAEGRS
jgi:hypothetical protein